MTPAATLPDFLARITTRTAHIGIVGLGYVGLPLSLLFAQDGFRITGFDIDAQKVETLNAGRSYIHRIEPTDIAAAQAAGFHATTDFAAIAQLDAILICVPTPLHPDHTPDMSFVVSTIEAIAPHLRPGQLVVLESTTYPGTTEEIIAATIERHGQKVSRPSTALPPTTKPGAPHPAPGMWGESPESSTSAAPLQGVLVAFSPEREDPGNLTTPRREIPKVVGGICPLATTAACALYGAVFHRTIPMSSTAAAEMTKLLENIFRSVNIALVNQMKVLALAMGIDIWEVIAAAATKPFGFMPFLPGPGVGGHCIPVDPFYLSWKAREFGLTVPFIELAGQTNAAMPAFIVETTRRALLAAAGTALAGAHILVLGIAYKRDVDDLRESPALTVIELLQTAGAQVAYNDPFFPTVGTGRHYTLNLTSTPLTELAAYDCVLILTDHTTYDYPSIIAQSRLIIDTRNATRNATAAHPSPKVIRC